MKVICADSTVVDKLIDVICKNKLVNGLFLRCASSNEGYAYKNTTGLSLIFLYFVRGKTTRVHLLISMWLEFFSRSQVCYLKYMVNEIREYLNTEIESPTKNNSKRNADKVVATQINICNLWLPSWSYCHTYQN